MEDVINLDLAANEIHKRADNWAARGLAVGKITWRDQTPGELPVIRTERSEVKNADSIGVRLQYGDAEAEIVLFRGGWADRHFWIGDADIEPHFDHPGFDAPLDVEQFGWELDRLFRHFEVTGKVATLRTIAHAQPDNSDSSLQIALGTWGDMGGCDEQIWTKQIDATHFILRSIPFFAYGMAPADLLETSHDLQLKSVVNRGRAVLRVILPHPTVEQFQNQIGATLNTLNLRHEWDTTGQLDSSCLAVELATAEVPELLRTLLGELEQHGAAHEVSP